MNNHEQHSPPKTAPSAAGLFTALLLFSLLAPQSAWATYLDPITGSIVLQVVTAGFIAAMTSIRQLRAWLMNSLRRLFTRHRA